MQDKGRGKARRSWLWDNQWIAQHNCGTHKIQCMREKETQTGRERVRERVSQKIMCNTRCRYFKHVKVCLYLHIVVYSWRMDLATSHSYYNCEGCCLFVVVVYVNLEPGLWVNDICMCRSSSFYSNLNSLIRKYYNQIWLTKFSELNFPCLHFRNEPNEINTLLFCCRNFRVKIIRLDRMCEYANVLKITIIN